MTFFKSTAPTISVAGKTLIVPIVSTANVPQLAVDILISSLDLQRIGIFDSRTLVPVVGGREDGQPGVTTPLELYGKDGVDVVVVQQRSPALKSHKEEFVRELLTFIGESKFGAVIFLSGVEVTNRTDSQMSTPTYHIRPENTPSWESSALGAFSSLPIPIYTSPVSQHPQQDVDESAVPFVPGGGLTRRILSSFPTPWMIPTVALLHFVVEGDNMSDAQYLAAVVAKAAGLELTQWRLPSSWRQGLFGAPHDQTLYG